MRKLIFCFFILILFCGSVFPVFAQDLSSSVNSLRRVWLDEIAQMATQKDAEEGNYRLDPDFELGYGDSLKVILWGRIAAEYDLIIDRQGEISIPNLGKISVIGMSMDQAREAISRELNKQYTNVNLDVTLADVRDIRIYVMGNVVHPGSYSTSPFARVTDALIAAGGPTENGSLIDIKVFREGQEVGHFNMYDFFINDDHSQNIRLKQGDTVHIGEVQGLYAIKGDVRHSGLYEIPDQVRISDLITQAGGMLNTKFMRKILLVRINVLTQQQEVVEEFNFDQQKSIPEEHDVLLEYDDLIIVTTSFNYKPDPMDLYKDVTLKGEFVIPGKFLVGQKDRLSSVLKKTGGMRSNAFVEGAVFVRQSLKMKQKELLEEQIRAQEQALLKQEMRLAQAMLDDDERVMRQTALEKQREALNRLAARVPQGRMIIDLHAILDGQQDILLQDGDYLFVPQIPDSVLVSGAVYRPSAVFYQNGKSLDDYLKEVGGPTQEADKDDVYILKANGTVCSQCSGYGNIGPGDVIVVPEKE